MAEDNLSKFKQILAKLPEEKRKLLYNRLHDLPASEREAFIADFIKKYNAGTKKNSSPDNQQVKKKPVVSDKTAPQKKEAKPVKPALQKKEVKTDKPSEKKPLPKEDPEVKKISKNPEAEPVTSSDEGDNVKPKKNASQSILLGFLVAFVIIGSLYFIYVFNKDAIDSKFNQMLGMPAEEPIDMSQNTEDIVGPAPIYFPTSTPTPIPPTPTPAPVQVPEDHPDLTGLVIVIDPGHQANPDSGLEISIPGSTAEKERATTGATGINSGVKEYELTLKYALIMKEYLEGCGAEVILTRETNETSLSNIERAEIATSNNADYFIRLHADSAPDSEIQGVKVYVPSTGKYSSSAASEGRKLAEAVASGIGSQSLGVVQSNMYTGLNNADSIKSYQLVIGYLSNSSDDSLLSKADTPVKTAAAVAEFLAK